LSGGSEYGGGVNINGIGVGKTVCWNRLGWGEGEVFMLGVATFFENSSVLINIRATTKKIIMIPLCLNIKFFIIFRYDRAQLQ
jgi:hypothetical protein